MELYSNYTNAPSSFELFVAVEIIEKTRQPYPTLAAIYFLTPCRESILRLVDDFSAHKEPLYNTAHVHFTGGKQFIYCYQKKNKKTSSMRIMLTLLSTFILLYRFGRRPFLRPQQSTQKYWCGTIYPWIERIICGF